MGSAKVVPLCEVAEVRGGGKLKLSGKDFVPEGFPAFGAGGLNGYLPVREFDRRGVVLASTGTCGRCYLTPPDWTSLANTQVILPYTEIADSRFLWYQLNDPSRWPISGTAQPFIKPSDVKAHLVYLPTIEEQRRIALILDAANALREKRQQALEKLDTLAHAIFLEICGEAKDRVTIGQLLADGALELHKDGNHGSLYPRADEFGESGVAFLSARCISDQGDLLLDEVQFLDEEKARKLKLGWIRNGDVLLAHNASVGKTLLYQGEFTEALIGTSLTAFRPNPKKLDSRFLYGALRSREFQFQLTANMGQTTRNQVPITAQRSLSLSVPSIEQQRRFAEAFNTAAEQKTLQDEQLRRLTTLFALLQHRAFRGEL